MNQLPNSRFNQMRNNFVFKSGEALYSCTWSVGRSIGQLQRWADTSVTLAFEDAQVIPPFSREETDDTDNTDDTDDTDDTGIGWKRLE